MDFLGTITPREFEAGRALTLVTMAALVGSGVFPPLRPYGYHIRLVFTVGYIACVLGFVAYCVFFR